MVEQVAVQSDASLTAEEIKQFRQVLGRFASGITVLTAKLNGEVRAMTASAFMSGSLIPPLVVISIARNAKLHDRIATSGSFGVSILDERQEPHSRYFAGQPGPPPEPLFDDETDVPLVAGALAGLVATVEEAYPCGDHTLFVGRVRHLRDRAGMPLLHFGGGYHRLDKGAP